MQESNASHSGVFRCVRRVLMERVKRDFFVGCVDKPTDMRARASDYFRWNPAVGG
jgi:hypothetical protein